MGTSASISSMGQSTIEAKSPEEKISEILEKIRKEPQIVDLKILFYIAACESMAGTNKLIPNPKDYLKKEYGKERIQEINETIPNVKLLEFYLMQRKTDSMSDDTLSVLYWLLIGLKEPRLLVVDKQEDWPSLDIGEQLQPMGDQADFKKPDMVLKVCYSTMSCRYIQWKSNSYGKKTLFGYTKVRLQDVHGALHCGPGQLITKVGLGYLLPISSTLWPIYSRKKKAWTWGKSGIGTEMSVTMVIEFVKSAGNKIKFTKQKEAYYLISDSSFARIRYVLIWIHSKPPARPELLPEKVRKDHYKEVVGSLVLVAALFLPKRMPDLIYKCLTSMNGQILNNLNH